jgi:hypothetical protein
MTAFFDQQCRVRVGHDELEVLAGVVLSSSKSTRPGPGLAGPALAGLALAANYSPSRSAAQPDPQSESTPTPLHADDLPAVAMVATVAESTELPHRRFGHLRHI